MSLIDAPYRFTATQKFLLGIAGIIVFIVAWWGLAELLATERPLVDINTRPPSSLSLDPAELAKRDSILRADSIKLANATEFVKDYPLLSPPHHVVAAFPSIIKPADSSWWWPASGKPQGIIPNALISIWRNLQGYFWAVFISLLIGIPVALSPTAKAMFAKQIDVLRYIPLTAVFPLFVAAFEYGEPLKVNFLAFGILVYLLPVVMQRVWETESVYLKTAFTLGASDWQLIKTVYLPSVLGKLIDDIRVLTAISWTYIIIAESLNRDTGLGSLLYIFARLGKMPSVYAVLIVIIIIGFLQDRFFVYMNNRLFPHKTFKRMRVGMQETKLGFLTLLATPMVYLLLRTITGSKLPLLGTFVGITCLAALLIILYGEYKLRFGDSKNTADHA
ncbi:MAG: ABC transporter permease subunit [Bacteroidota bacterium]